MPTEIAKALNRPKWREMSFEGSALSREAALAWRFKILGHNMLPRTLAEQGETGEFTPADVEKFLNLIQYKPLQYAEGDIKDEAKDVDGGNSPRETPSGSQAKPAPKEKTYKAVPPPGDKARTFKVHSYPKGWAQEEFNKIKALTEDDNPAKQRGRRDAFNDWMAERKMAKVGLTYGFLIEPFRNSNLLVLLDTPTAVAMEEAGQFVSVFGHPFGGEWFPTTEHIGELVAEHKEKLLAMAKGIPKAPQVAPKGESSPKPAKAGAEAPPKKEAARQERKVPEQAKAVPEASWYCTGCNQVKPASHWDEAQVAACVRDKPKAPAAHEGAPPKPDEVPKKSYKAVAEQGAKAGPSTTPQPKAKAQVKGKEREQAKEPAKPAAKPGAAKKPAPAAAAKPAAAKPAAKGAAKAAPKETEKAAPKPKPAKPAPKVVERFLCDYCKIQCPNGHWANEYNGLLYPSCAQGMIALAAAVKEAAGEESTITDVFENPLNIKGLPMAQRLGLSKEITQKIKDALGNVIVAPKWALHIYAFIGEDALTAMEAGQITADNYREWLAEHYDVTEAPAVLQVPGEKNLAVKEEVKAVKEAWEAARKDFKGVALLRAPVSEAEFAFKAAWQRYTSKAKLLLDKYGVKLPPIPALKVRAGKRASSKPKPGSRAPMPQAKPAAPAQPTSSSDSSPGKYDDLLSVVSLLGKLKSLIN